jgi:hypothetical protein
LAPDPERIEVVEEYEKKVEIEEEEKVPEFEELDELETKVEDVLLLPEVDHFQEK